MQDFVQELECVSQEPKDESDGGEEEAEVPQVLCDVGVFFAERTLTGIQALSWGLPIWYIMVQGKKDRYALPL